MVCSKCQSHRMHRIKRQGFLRVRLAPLLGYFPWRCSVCGTEQLLKARGVRKSTRNSGNTQGNLSSPATEPMRREPAN